MCFTYVWYFITRMLSSIVNSLLNIKIIIHESEKYEGLQPLLIEVGTKIESLCTLFTYYNYESGWEKITHYDYHCKYRFWKINWACICDKTLLEVFIISGHLLKILVVKILNTLKWHIFSIVYFAILMWLFTIVPEVKARQLSVSLNEIDLL